jgi:AhpD family alkylhydroperoxidase
MALPADLLVAPVSPFPATRGWCAAPPAGTFRPDIAREGTMEMRIDYGSVATEATQAMLGLEGYVHGCDLEPALLELVKMRASQLNGCAYCLDMHSKDARAGGETEQRLYLLPAWREAPFYSPRERAALAWTEALTLISATDITDELYAATREHFDEGELVGLTMAVIAINGWNRLSIAFRSPVGSYQPKAQR